MIALGVWISIFIMYITVVIVHNRKPAVHNKRKTVTETSLCIDIGRGEDPQGNNTQNPKRINAFIPSAYNNRSPMRSKTIAKTTTPTTTPSVTKTTTTDKRPNTVTQNIQRITVTPTTITTRIENSSKSSSVSFHRPNPTTQVNYAIESAPALTQKQTTGPMEQPKLSRFHKLKLVRQKIFHPQPPSYEKTLKMSSPPEYVSNDNDGGVTNMTITAATAYMGSRS